METRNCQHCKESFLITSDEFSMYKKVGIELPITCFYCRVKQQFAFWSFGKFRKGLSALTGNPIITTLSEKVAYPIYSLAEWYSDAWDPMDFGKPYNPNQSFFEQFAELQKKVPRPHQSAGKSTGCDWCDDAWNSKNCYLSRSMEACEDLLYSYRNMRCKNSIDLVYCYDMDSSYNCTYCFHSYNLFSSFNSRDCVDSAYLFDCRNCTSCFMCWNLRGKSYCIENKQYSKEEYENKIREYKNGSWKTQDYLNQRFQNFIKNEVVHRATINFKTSESTGNYLVNTNNCVNCYMLEDSEDCYNVIRGGIKDRTMIDSNGCWASEMMGNSSCCVGSYGLKYSLWSSSRFGEYLDFCEECEYCFGCIGLRKKKFCILNVQYTKEEYKKIKEEIIANMKKDNEYGKFFPYKLGTVPFNFSTSYLFFPETKRDDIENLGGVWEDLDESHIEGMSTDDLPDLISDVQDNIIKTALVCPTTGWRFNVSENELQFYKQHSLPLPREHFDVRIKKNFYRLAPIRPYETECNLCNKSITTYYPPEWGYKNVVCEECYLKNIN